ncbi:MAG: trypsin-like peptidase domain-containing protein [Bacteroidales bacterium]|jgi:Do/DeqQ family serine protease|nr:trypsin-like peptidase domain-containing protein [Bacteroidales bacterium]
MKRRKDCKLLFFSFLLVAGLNSCAQSPQSEPNANSSLQYVDLTLAAAESIHAVVHIKTEFRQKNAGWDYFFGGSIWEHFSGRNSSEYPVIAAGSGVIIDPAGFIVTNNHVVEGAEKITVTLNDKREFSATIAGTDPQADLALIKIEATDLPTLAFANSDIVKIGEWVLAVGNPFNLTSTVTAGIVSAKARNLDLLDNNSSVSSFIQTDAAVNQGNSGGALVNASGKLIGINTAIASRNGYFTGYSFAIPSNIVKKVISDLKQYGKVQYAYLGVQLSEIDAKRAEELKLSEVKGLYIAKNLLNKAGMKQNELEVGDIILNIDNQPVNSMSELKEILAQHSPGEKVKIIYLRNNKEVTSDVTFLNSFGKTDIVENLNISDLFKANFRNLTQKEKYRNLVDGVVIEQIKEGALSYAGVKEGFILTGINNKVIKNVTDMENMLENYNNKLILFEGFYENSVYRYAYTIQIPD